MLCTLLLSAAPAPNDPKGPHQLLSPSLWLCPFPRLLLHPILSPGPREQERVTPSFTRCSCFTDWLLEPPAHHSQALPDPTQALWAMSPPSARPSLLPDGGAAPWGAGRTDLNPRIGTQHKVVKESSLKQLLCCGPCLGRPGT